MANNVLCLALMLQCLSGYQLSSIAAAPLESGCVADMFTTAGISAQRAVAYEQSFSSADVPASSVLYPVSIVLLRVAGIDSAEDRRRVVACFGNGTGVSTSSACQAFSSCGSDGVCTLVSEQYRCRCNTVGHHGNRCEIDACEENPCKNGGTCHRNTSTPHYACECPNGFHGTTCSGQVDHCASSPCRNGASCENIGVRVTCRCPVGYRGEICQEKWEVKEFFADYFAKVLAGQKSFKLHNDPSTWDEAETRCSQEGGRLAFIRSKYELEKASSLSNYISNAEYWIGAEDRDRDGVYRWVNGDAMAYDNWGVSKPNPDASIGDCLTLRRIDRLWNHRPCDSRLFFLCEM